jgi:hypothetical protein
MCKISLIHNNFDCKALSSHKSINVYMNNTKDLNYIKINYGLISLYSNIQTSEISVTKLSNLLRSYDVILNFQE